MSIKNSIRHIILILVSLFAVNAASQHASPQTEHLDFGQFSTVIPVDRLTFMDRLKLAGLKIVQAPAEERLVSLYKYNGKDIKRGSTDCSDAKYGSHHALLTRFSPGEGQAEWREIGFSNSCDLQYAINFIINDEDSQDGWQPVQDQKLASIIKEENASEGLGVILTKRLFKEDAEHYFAECKPGSTGEVFCASDRN